MSEREESTDERSLMRQLREANGELVVATIRAESFAEQAEAARRLAAESEERFRTLVVASSALVWRANEAGDIAVQSEGWSAQIGEPLEGGSWLAVVHPDDRDAVEREWRGAVAASTVYVCEHRLRKRDGAYAWVESRAVPILRNGVAREWIGMMTDITERIAMEHARERFMAILSHDLRSPLAAVTLSADALRGLRLDMPWGALVDEIYKTARRMAELVQDVMDFARGRLGNGIPLWAGRCDLSAVCADMIAEARRAHPNREIRLITPGELVGEWDAERLAQVVANLVGNAITHGGDPIVVALREAQSEIVLSVESQSAPIPESVRAALFEPFSRSHPDAPFARRSGGLGLGLYIVSEIVKAHHGSITVRSVPNTTTFEVTLPRAPSQ
jgi:PAS domain S-box-containing protein